MNIGNYSFFLQSYIVCLCPYMYVFPVKYKLVFSNIKLLDHNSLYITTEDRDRCYGEIKLNNKILFLPGKLGSLIDHLLQRLLIFTMRQE